MDKILKFFGKIKVDANGIELKKEFSKISSIK